MPSFKRKKNKDLKIVKIKLFHNVVRLHLKLSVKKYFQKHYLQ